MPERRTDRRSRGGIPHPRCLVITGGDDPRAVRAKTRTNDMASMLERRTEGRSRGGVPHPRCFVTTGCDDPRVVRAKRSL